jgi:cytidyltransferase-like protein
MKRDLISKIIDLKSLIEELRANYQGKSVGLCHGVFDVLHVGHINHFQEASKLVDVLIVSVTTDIYVNKGPGRPINKISDRVSALAGIESIDYVLESESPSAVEVIKKIKPELYFKGKDYERGSTYRDMAGNLNDEKFVLQENNGQIYFTQSELRSSSSIINSLNKLSPSQLDVITHIKKYISENPIQEIINKLKKQKITVIGEIIHDEYIFTESLGKSGKHPLVAEKELYRKNFLGGIAPVVDTLSTFVDDKNISVISLQNAHIPKNTSKNLNSVLVDSKYIDIKKTRYINDKTNTFMYEKYQMNDEYISRENETKIIDLLVSSSNNCDLLVTLDFGHGLITPLIRDYMTSNFTNIALNVQRNAGNKGFNNVGKYKTASLIVMNGEEVELELKQKGVSIEEAAKIIHTNMSAKIVVITDGSKGLVITNGSQIVRIPSFHTGKVIDRTGAGDALFTILSMFYLVVDDLTVLGYLGNLAGSINLNWFANEKTVTAEDIIKSVYFGLK